LCFTSLFVADLAASYFQFGSDLAEAKKGWLNITLKLNVLRQ